MGNNCNTCKNCNNCEQCIPQFQNQKWNRSFFQQCLQSSRSPWVQQLRPYIYTKLKYPLSKQIKPNQQLSRKPSQHSNSTTIQSLKFSYYVQDDVQIWEIKGKYPEKGVMIIKSFLYYEGDIYNNMAHGNGLVKFIGEERVKYQGEMKENQFSGKGQYCNQGRNIKYKGLFQKGYPTEGEIHWDNCKIIVQHFQLVKNKSDRAKVKIQVIRQEHQIHQNAQIPINISYKYDGQITLETFSKQVFNFEGEGFIQFPDGSTYTGSWLGGTMHGEGRYCWNNGDIYEGKYYLGQKQGSGTFYYRQQKCKYVGCWMKNQILQKNSQIQDQQVLIKEEVQDEDQDQEGS